MNQECQIVIINKEEVMLDYKKYITLIESIDGKIYANDEDTGLTIENVVQDLIDYILENNLNFNWFVRRTYVDFNDFGNHKLSKLAYSIYNDPKNNIHCNDGDVVRNVFYSDYLNTKLEKFLDEKFLGAKILNYDFFEYDINNIKLKKKINGIDDYHKVPPVLFNKYLQQQQQYRKTPSNTKNSISYIITVYEKTDFNHLKRIIQNIILNSPIENYEIILVSNFHKEFKKEEISFEKKFNYLKTVRIINKENGNKSIYEAYLYGAENALKEFIWFIDSDDEFFALDNLKEIKESVKFIIINKLPNLHKYNFDFFEQFALTCLIFKRTYFESLLKQLELKSDNVNCYGLLDNVIVNCACENIVNGSSEIIDASDILFYSNKEIYNNEHISISDSYIINNYKSLKFIADTIKKTKDARNPTIKNLRDELLTEIRQAPVSLSREFINNMIDGIVENYEISYEELYKVLIKEYRSTYYRLPKEKETGNIIKIFEYLKEKLGASLKAIDNNAYSIFKYADKIKEIGEKYNIYTTDDKFVINIILFGDKYKELKIIKRSKKSLEELYGNRDDVVINYLDENFLNEFKVIPSTAFVLNESEEKPTFANCTPDYIKIIYSVLDKEVCWLDSDICVYEDFIPLLKEKKYCCGHFYNIGEISYYKGINDFYFKIFLAHNAFMRNEYIKYIDRGQAFSIYTYMDKIDDLYYPKDDFKIVIPNNYYFHHFTSMYGKNARKLENEISRRSSIILDKELLDDYIKVFEINNEIDDNSHN